MHNFILGNAIFAFVIILMMPSWPAWGEDSTTGNTNMGNSGQMPNTTNNVQAPTSPEDRLYQEQMIKISDAITQKISEIEAKQKEIDSEIYPASKPPLEGDLVQLQNQLRDLEMQRDQLQTEKASRDLSQQLKTSQ